MGSTRAGAGEESTGRGADLLTSAAALRWARPDLTGAIADHVLETAAIASDRDRWLAAAGWAVHARSATGDGREIAADVIGQLSGWGSAPLDHPAARRLRVELALVAAAAGQVETGRGLLGPVVVDDGDPELRADLSCVLARCAVEDAPERVAEALRSATAAWSAVPGPVGQVGAASVALISAVVERRKGRPDAAVEHAADGLTKLERGRGAGSSGTPSGHLAAALAAEWISALLDAGRPGDARDGCVPLMPRLAEPARPSRQLALLRLTVARAVATGDGAGSVDLLEQAAEDAAASDAPDLESVCRTALGALQEQAGQIDAALETLRLGVAAERRDRSRIARFRTALAQLPAEALRAAPAANGRPAGNGRAAAGRSTTDVPSSAASPAPASSAPASSAPAPTSSSRRARPEASVPASDHDWEALLRPAASNGRTNGHRSEPDPQQSTGRGKRRRPDDGNDQHGNDEHRERHRSDPAEDVGEPRSRRAADPERRESGRRRAAESPGDPLLGTGWSTVPWEGTAGESPIGDLLFRSLSSGGSGSDDTEPGNGSDTPRRNGSHGQGAREDTGGRHESGSAEPGRNGRAGPRAEEPSSASDASGDRGVARDARPERNGLHGGEQPTSRRSRRENRPDTDTDADSGFQAWGWESAAASWFPQQLSERASADVQPTNEERPSRRRSSRSAGRGEDRETSPGSDSEDRVSGDTGRRSRRSESSGRENGLRSGGSRHRAEDPWSTGQWPATDSGADATDELADRSAASTEVLPTAPATGGANDPDSWLQAALADLDRMWGGTKAEPARSTDSRSTEHGATTDADPCVVMIDVARDGRRFAGRRAGAVVRAVADRLTDRLPPGARLQLGESDVLSITLPAWDRAAATEWMHRTLPGLLAGFEAGEDLPAAQLRAAVHDSNGPVGAQILQSLERPVDRVHGGRSGSPGRSVDRPDDQQAARGNGRRRAEEDLPARKPASDLHPLDPGWKAPASDEPTGERASARHGGDAGIASGGSNGGGRRRRREADAEAGDRGPAGRQEADRGSEGGSAGRSERREGGTAAAEAKTESSVPASESTEGLGIADLLAGALAAYRAI